MKNILNNKIHKNKKYNDEEIIKLYKENPSYNFIIKNLNCSKSVICNCLKKNNINHKKNYNRSFYINENYFHKINTENKAYWLGFLYAGAYINEKQGLLKIALHEKDENHLIKFLKDLHSNYEIKEYRKGYKEIRIWNRNLINDLVLHGCMQRKSNKIKFPYFINNNLIRHFIRGYFDGNGGVTYGNNKRLSLNFTGYYPFLINLIEYIHNDINIKIPKYYPRRKTSLEYGSFCYTKWNEIINFFKFIYKNSNIFLDRKYEKLINIFKIKYENKYTHIKTKILIFELNKDFDFLKRKNIIYDIDSVLANFVGGILKRAKELGYESFPENENEVNCWNICEDFNKVFKTTHKDKEFWLNLELMPNTKREFNVDYYLTARCIPTSWTEKWIKKVKLPKAKVITVNSPLEKIKILKLLNPILFIDDNWEIIKEANKNGINAYLFKQPHQKEYREEINKCNINIIEDLQELNKIIQR